VPALTTIQLFDTHSKYLDASDQEKPEEFRHALNEVMPRIYKMGFWREMLVEHTQDASKGYISLPEDTDSIVAGLLDNNPVPTRSLWHDYKMFGTNDDDETQLTAFIDDGYASTYREIEKATFYNFQLQVISDYNNSLPTSAFDVKILYRGSNTGIGFNDFLLNNTTTAGTGSGVNVSSIDQIIFNNIPEKHSIRVQADPADDSFDPIVLADLPSGSGVVRYRRYRIGNTNSDSSAHVLAKKRWVDCTSNNDLVHVPSNAIVKHALLGKLAEDNADLQRSQYHWGTVSQLLETDTDSYRGAAKPTLHIAPNGVGGGMTGMY
jgi:hypothetical protein